MDNQLNLRDRAVLIAGPFSTCLQNVMIGLTQMGADVALLDKDAQAATKFCQNLVDQREVNEKYGRAIAIKTDLSDKKQMKDAVGQVAQTFGSLDIYIDAHLNNAPTPFNLSGDESDIESIVHTNLVLPMRLTQAIIPYLKGRKRGRILFLTNSNSFRAAPEDIFVAASRSGLIQFVKALAFQTQELHLTVNVLALGLTEEYILGHYPGATSIKDALEKIRMFDPGARITEPDRVTQSILFLVSQYGLGISGQIITAN